MKFLVLYDSFYGNTEKVAQQVGQGLSRMGSVSITKVDEFKQEDLTGLDWIFLGSPTRAFTYSPKIKTWLTSLQPDALKGIHAAAFDTRISMADVNSGFLNFLVKLFGYAGEKLLKGMQKKGGIPAQPVGQFFVKESEGPLKDDELTRAAEWAQEIVSQ